jgi:hypothetical protein
MLQNDSLIHLKTMIFQKVEANNLSMIKIIFYPESGR